jgi:hypothetical protein
MVASLGSFYRKGVEDVAVTDGGTGASDGAAALTNLNHDTRDHTGITGVGKVVQVVQDEFTGTNDPGSAISADGTIPQNTEGAEVLSAAITPVSSSNILLIEAVVYIGHSAGSSSNRILALFKDSDANATAAANQFDSSGEVAVVTLRKVITSPTTSAQTWRIRAGNDTNNARVNGDLGSTTPLGAAMLASTLTITEIAP